jgi:hypothetical protein
MIFLKISRRQLTKLPAGKDLPPSDQEVGIETREEDRAEVGTWRRAGRPMIPGTRWRPILAQLMWLAVFAIPPNLALLYVAGRTVRIMDVREKIARFANDRGRYDLVFVGDSRTYCDFDPEQIDPLLGTHSFNLAYWAHWFPTQYPSFQDIIPLLEPGTVVVWSIGHRNFRPVQATVNTAYPIGLGNVGRYLRWGYPPSAIEDNVASSFLDVAPVHAQRDRIRSLFPLLTIPFVPSGAGGSAVSLENQSRYDALKAQLELDKTVERVRPWIDGSTVTSIEVLKTRGNYTRIELSPSFFREKQSELAQGIRPLPEGFTASPEYWNTFVGILDLFQSHHVRLIVNEVEEAPYNYDIAANAEASRSFMREVRSYVERRGIPYTRVAWEEFGNDDYFDYNHLNSQGIARFTPLLAAQLRPYLR